MPDLTNRFIEFLFSDVLPYGGDKTQAAAGFADSALGNGLSGDAPSLPPIDMDALGGELQQLFDINQLEQNDNLIRQKSLFENLSQYTVNPSLGIFRDGGMNVSGIPNPTVDFDKNVSAVRRTNANKFVLDVLERQPIQAEKGEALAHDSGLITKVAADKKHGQMEDDKVTDFVPDGSYVFSKNGFKLSSKEAEKITTDVKIPPYDKFGNTKEPTETTLADFMKGKKKMSPADIAFNIAKTYKQTEEDDILSRKTNELNLENSLPAIKALITLSEIKKENIRTPLEEELTVDSFGMGGYVKKKDVPKAELGLMDLIPALIGRIGGFQNIVASGVGGLVNNHFAKKQTKKNNKAIEGLADTQTQFNQAGILAGLASVLGQDPTVDAPVQQTGFLNQIPTRTPQSVLDNLASRLAGQTNTDAVFANAPSFAAATAALNNTNVQNASVLGQAGLKAFQDFQNRETNRLQQVQGIVNNNIVNATGAKNQTVANQNSQLGAVGSQVQGGLRTQSAIETSKVNAKLANENNLASQQAGLRNNFLGSVKDFNAAGAGQAASALSNSNLGADTFNTSDNLSYLSPSIDAINQNTSPTFQQSNIDGSGFTPEELKTFQRVLSSVFPNLFK